MIARILTEGQYNIPDCYIGELNEIDNHLVAAVAEENQEEFHCLLKKMLDLVRGKGTPVSVDELVGSEPDLTLQEAEELFVGEGLLPG